MKGQASHSQWVDSVGRSWSRGLRKVVSSPWTKVESSWTKVVSSPWTSEGRGRTLDYRTAQTRTEMTSFNCVVLGQIKASTWIIGSLLMLFWKPGVLAGTWFVIISVQVTYTLPCFIVIVWTYLFKWYGTNVYIFIVYSYCYHVDSPSEKS